MFLWQIKEITFLGDGALCVGCWGFFGAFFFFFLKVRLLNQKRLFTLHGKAGVKSIPNTLKCKRQGVLWFLFECVPAGTFF